MDAASARIIIVNWFYFLLNVQGPAKCMMIRSAVMTDSMPEGSDGDRDTPKIVYSGDYFLLYGSKAFPAPIGYPYSTSPPNGRSLTE